MNIESLDAYRLFCRGGLADLYPFFHKLRAEDPVHWSSVLNGWVLTRYNDVFAALRDLRLSSARVHLFMDKLHGPLRDEAQPLGDHLSKWVSLVDPPDHTRLRGLVNRAFTPKTVEAMRDHIQSITYELLDALADREQFDLINDFAYYLPATVICELLGVPPGDRAEFRRWADDLSSFLGGSSLTLPEIAGQACQSLNEMSNYFRVLIEERRSRPGEDLTSALIQVEEEGDRLNDGELLGMVTQLFIAGQETTVNLIANGILSLLQNPAEMEKLKNEPALIASAVEEFLRYDGPSQRQMRTACEDIEIDGHPIKKGQAVISMLGAANRDPAQFSDPDRLDICRRENRHVGFGSGIHYCLGASLARLEGQIAINTLLQRFPEPSLATTKLEWRENMTVRGLKALPVARRMQSQIAC